MGLAFIGPSLFLCYYGLSKALLNECSPVRISNDMWLEILGEQFESIYDKLLFSMWPLVGPLFFIYAKFTKDQEKLDKFYRRYWWELTTESCAQMVLQWHVIANYRKVIEGRAWAFTSAILSTASVANGVRLGTEAIRKGRPSGWRGYIKPLGLFLWTGCFWTFEVYIIGQFEPEELANQAFNITLVATTSTTIPYRIIP